MPLVEDYSIRMMSTPNDETGEECSHAIKRPFFAREEAASMKGARFSKCKEAAIRSGGLTLSIRFT